MHGVRGDAVSLEVRGVVKSYGSLRAVDGISLTVRAGTILSLLGPSGCGKTTLLRTIAGFVTPDAGSVLIDGRDVTSLPPRLRNVGMVFQHYALFPHMTVEQNVSYGLRMKRTPPEETRRRVTEALRLVRLEGLENRLPAQLSGGQQQRVALARALVMNPRVLLLDEPLGALDLNLRRYMQVELKQIQRQTGVTMVYVTHDQEEALALSDEVAVLNAGRIEQLGTPQEIYQYPASTFVANFIGHASVLWADVVARGGDEMALRLAGECTVTVPARAVPDFAKGASRVPVVIRPERVQMLRLHPRGGSMPRAGDDRPGSSYVVGSGQPAAVVRGRVQEGTYQGDAYLYRVALMDESQLQVRVPVNSPDLFSHGDEVECLIDTDGLRIVRESEVR